MYEHTIKDMFYPGLPVGDLDESTLTDEQKALLAAAVAKGVYTLIVTENEGVNDDESTFDQAEKAEDDHEGTEDQATGGGSNTVQW